PDSCDKAPTVEFFSRMLMKEQGRFARAPRVIGLGVRCVPKRKNGIANILYHSSICRMDASSDRGIEIAVHHCSELRGIHALRNGRKAGDIAEKDCDFLF